MATVTLDCPHCGTKRSGFGVKSLYVSNPSRLEYWFFASCGVGECAKPIVFLAQVNGGDPLKSVKTPDVRRVHPAQSVMPVPAHLPERCEKAYAQGVNTLMQETADAAGSMFRKALDIGIHELDPDLPKNLNAAINKLAERGVITESLKDWAHHIRDLGNDAAHNDFTFEEAQEMRDFTELVLTYLWTLPGRISARMPPEAAEEPDDGERQE